MYIYIQIEIKGKQRRKQRRNLADPARPQHFRSLLITCTLRLGGNMDCQHQFSDRAASQLFEPLVPYATSFQ